MKKKLKCLLPIFLAGVLSACGNRTNSIVNQDNNMPVSQETQYEHGSISENVQLNGGKPETMVEEPLELHPYDFTLAFAGDVNLDENWATTSYLNTCENGIYDCLSPELIMKMKEADITCINNEFTYSLQGEPLPNKMYTFRANPSRVEVLQELGVDVVLLANNHVYDYGKQSLLDTLDTLERANIAYTGAGRNLEEAMEPVYLELDGKKIAIVSASRAEKYKMTPQATENEPGILRCYDNSLFLEAIAKAKTQADFVIAWVHWGTEESTVLEEVQLSTGKEYIDAGADVVIGGHSHCLQGMEYYNGKPILYSLGDYWFNGKTEDTALFELQFSGDDNGGKIELAITPAIQSGCYTKIADKEERERIFRHLESISINIGIDENGLVYENK